jgi:hypothetical protein
MCDLIRCVPIRIAELGAAATGLSWNGEQLRWGLF